MKKFSYFLILSAFLFSKFAVAEVNLPVERLNEEKVQREQNKNNDLFKNKEIYDLKEERQRLESKEMQEIFRKNDTKESKQLFQEEIKVNIQKKQTKKRNNYKYLWIVLCLGGIISGYMFWRDRNEN